MATVVKMPQLGESIVEGTVARWLKAPGENIDKFEPLLEITTDKIDTEIPSPAAGILLTIVATEGETVAVGGILGHIGEEGESVAVVDVNSTSEDNGTVADHRVVEQLKRSFTPKPSGRDFVSPVVARIAREHAVDLNALSGTGMGGRITKQDILAFVDQEMSTEPVGVGNRRLATSDGQDEVNSGCEVEHGELSPDEILQPLSPMRRAIAQHMVLSKQTSPHVTTVYEVDMTAVVHHREANRQPFADKGIALTYTPYFIAAVAAALRDVPEANGRFTDDGIVFNRRIHIGVAVSLPDGLIVPVIRDADEKNLQGLARTVHEVAAAARGGRLTADATKGGTFTVTNHGVTGSLMGTPVINQPQSGILGIGMIAKRAVVRTVDNSLFPSADDAIVIRPICYLSFSFDHRVLDGAKADAFLTVVRERLEYWKE